MSIPEKARTRLYWLQPLATALAKAQDDVETMMGKTLQMFVSDPDTHDLVREHGDDFDEMALEIIVDMAAIEASERGERTRRANEASGGRNRERPSRPPPPTGSRLASSPVARGIHPGRRVGPQPQPPGPGLERLPRSPGGGRSRPLRRPAARTKRPREADLMTKTADDYLRATYRADLIRGLAAALVAVVMLVAWWIGGSR